MSRLILLALFGVASIARAGEAQDVSIPTPPEGGEMHAREVPIPTDVSPEFQAWIRSAIKPHANPWIVPRSPEGWRANWSHANDPVRSHEAVIAQSAKFGVRVTPEQIGGVPTYVIGPDSIAPRNQHRVVMYLHYGGYVSGAGESGLHEAIPLASYLGIKVISVDYRLPPDHPFPAALEDAVAVWRQIAKSTKSSKAAIAGSSAGGGLALSVVRKLIEINAPLPGAIYSGTPWTDLTVSSDSFFANDGIDDALSGARAFMLAAGKLYAGDYDLRNPLVSPVYADFTGFPPTILITGTRDILLSDTVRAHRKLLAAGAIAELHVFEAMSHGDYIWASDTPESREAYAAVSKFFERHLDQ